MFRNTWLLYDAPEGVEAYGEWRCTGVLGIAYWDMLGWVWMGSITRTDCKGNEKDISRMEGGA